MRKQCVVCGEAFDGHFNAGLCSPGCRAERNRVHCRDRSRRSAKRPDYIPCVVCGEDFKPRGNDKTCSKKCSQVNSTEVHRRWQGKPPRVYEKMCAVCGGGFTDNSQNGTVKTCSPMCHGAHRNKLGAVWKKIRAGRPLLYELCCKICGARFSSPRENEATCSKACHRQNRSLACVAWRERNRQKPLIKACAICAKEFDARRRAGGQRTKTCGDEACRAEHRLISRRDEMARNAERSRRWKVNNYDRRLILERRLRAEKNAALKLVRELQTKGMEALL